MKYALSWRIPGGVGKYHFGMLTNDTDTTRSDYDIIERSNTQFYLSAIPEPASGLLLLVGGALLALWRRLKDLV